MSTRTGDEDTPSSRVPSLTRLCTQQIVNSSDNIDLDGIDEHLKTVLLKHLLDERKVLLGERLELKGLRTQIAYIPAADQDIYFGHRGRHSPPPEAGENSDDDRKSIDVNNVNGYLVNDYFLSQWEYKSEDARRSPAHDADGMFSSNFDVLYRDSQSGEFRLCKRSIGSHGSNNTAECTWSRCHEYGESVYLHRMVASSTLLYRLVAAFGWPDCGTDGVDRYKSIWGVALRKIGDGTGELTLFDYKGYVSAHFYGDQEAGKSALKLLTWLVGDNIPHTYDGLLAGRAA